MKTARDRFSVASSNNLFEAFAVGGVSVGLEHSRLLDEVEKYILATNQWSALPRMLGPRFMAGTCVEPFTRLYVFCGMRGTHAQLKSV